MLDGVGSVLKMVKFLLHFWMLRAFGQLLYSISQHNLTMLADVALKCCVCFTGPQDLLDLEKTCPGPMKKMIPKEELGGLNV